MISRLTCAVLVININHHCLFWKVWHCSCCPTGATTMTQERASSGCQASGGTMGPWKKLPENKWLTI